MKRFLQMLIDKESSPFDMPYLPDDLLLNCLARVSRLYYPTLSLVSKRFRSLIASLELYKTRTLLGRTESCLYVCLGIGSGVFEYESNPRWFTLCRRPTQIFNPNPNPNPNPNSRWFTCCFRPYKIETNPTRKEEKKSSDNLLVSVPTPTRNFSHLFWWNCTAVGSNIYMIVVDEYNNGALSSSSRVFSMDCRSHTWHEAPSMRTARKYPIVSALDGKIYVVEGYKDLNSSNLIEFFDPKTQIWQHVPSPSAEVRLTIHSLAMDGKLYLFGINKSMVYNPKENTWDVLGLHLHLDLYFDKDTCVIDNTIYCCESSGKLQWYDFEGRSWRDLKGLEDLPTLPKRLTCVKLVNYGGKMAVLWQKVLADESAGIDHSMNQMIWCAEISLERRNNGQEIFGKIEWCDVVLTAPKSHLLKFVVAVNV